MRLSLLAKCNSKPLSDNAVLPETVTITIGIKDRDDDERLRKLVAKQLGVENSKLPKIRVLKRSIDARHRNIRFNLVLAIGEPEERAALGLPEPIAANANERVIVIGAGPAGLFCAYQLARLGIRSVVVDRGKQVQPRRRDLKLLNQGGIVDEDSNYCFGEGGAGTYSDGKLYTRSHKRGDVRDIIEILARHGAPEKILTDARPHIGSNILPKVITSMRELLASVGTEFLFGAKVIALLEDGNAQNRQVVGVKLADGQELEGAHTVLATGHSAGDIISMLAKSRVKLEAKPFAVGVRIEHRQEMIDKHQYGKFAGHPKLGAAAYRLAAQIDGRGVFSFCMCPGGWIVPAATEENAVVVNGMSLSKRDSKFANSGIVVAVEPADVQAAGFDGPTGGIELQRRIERAAGDAGGGALRAPASRAADFVKQQVSKTLPDTSYLPGLTPADVSAVLDSAGVDISSRLRAGLLTFNKKLPGFTGSDATIIGVETRTSSPVRVPRNPETLMSDDIKNLYPCGEGAGYAGGIVSAALDGIRIARAIASTC